MRGSERAEKWSCKGVKGRDGRGLELGSRELDRMARRADQRATFRVRRKQYSDREGGVRPRKRRSRKNEASVPFFVQGQARREGLDARPRCAS